MLYQSDRHEPLQSTPWSESQALITIQTIADDTIAQFDPDNFWPIHPLDRDEPPSTITYKSLYGGAAGVLWALSYLQEVEAIDVGFNPADFIDLVYDAYQVAPDTEDRVPSYFVGEVGILLVAWRLMPSDVIRDRLFTLIQSNISNPTNEAFWAAPGTMLGALFMLEWTQEREWEDLFLENADRLWSEWHYEPERQCHVWTQNLYGAIRQLTGPAHGFAGNLYALLRGVHLFSEAKRDQLYQRCIDVMQQTALVETDRANWPAAIAPATSMEKLLVQWCHGAPGMVTSLGDFPRNYSVVIDRLLIQAGELTWNAGPLTKGHGLCHGTAGNGYAFLKLYQRTEEEQWLERARSFAMHAIGQYERMKQEYHQGRYSLWTGDLGLAIYLWHCISGEANVPSLDIF